MRPWDRFDHDHECIDLARHFEDQGHIVRASGRDEINVRKPHMSRAVYVRKHRNGDHPPGKPWRIANGGGRSRWRYFGTLSEAISEVERF